jgi:hypothetical protein
LQRDRICAPHAIETLGAAEAAQIEEDISEYGRLGGLTLAIGGSPWANSPIVSSDEVQQAHAVLDELRRRTFPTVEAALEGASEGTRLPKPETIAGWGPRVELWGDFVKTLDYFTPEIYDRNLEEVCEQFAPASRGGVSRMKASLFSGDYKHVVTSSARSTWLRG